jgi:hypothetical protein
MEEEKEEYRIKSYYLRELAQREAELKGIDAVIALECNKKINNSDNFFEGENVSYNNNNFEGYIYESKFPISQDEKFKEFINKYGILTHEQLQKQSDNIYIRKICNRYITTYIWDEYTGWSSKTTRIESLNDDVIEEKFVRTYEIPFERLEKRSDSISTNDGCIYYKDKITGIYYSYCKLGGKWNTIVEPFENNSFNTGFLPRSEF